jgi:hypothetical protein
VRKLLIVFSMIPVGILLWPSSVPAVVCDPAISRGTCGGSGQKYPTFDRSTVCDRVPSKRILLNNTGRANSGNTAKVRLASLERTTKPTRAQYAPFSGMLIAMDDELYYRQGTLHIYRASGRSIPSQSGLRMAYADAGMPETFSVIRVVHARESDSQAGMDVPNGRDDKVSVSSSMDPVRPPSNGALLIAGFLGMCAVARRRLSSILG